MAEIGMNANVFPDKGSTTLDTPNAASVETGNGVLLSQSIFAERVEEAQHPTPTEIDPDQKDSPHPDPLKERLPTGAVGGILNLQLHPLKELWDNSENSITRLIPEIQELDQTWKPVYDEIVKSEGYGLNLDFQRTTNDIYNHVHVLTPESERDALWTNVLGFMKGDKEAEAALGQDPRALELAGKMKEIISNPNFRDFKDIAEAVSPLVEFSIQGREILAEESARQGEAGASLQLSLEATQLRNFVESMQKKGPLKILVNDSDSRI